MMHVSKVMTRNPRILAGTATVMEAARAMSEFDIGMTPVVEDGRVVGIVTDRDIVVRGVAKGSDPRQTSVSRIMSTDLVYCRGDQGIEEVGQLMRNRQLRRVLVLSEDNRLAGICSLGDIATAREEGDLGGEVLREVSKPDAEEPSS